MKICDKVHQIKIDFNVTQDISRYVYVYLIEGQMGCWLIDSGVAGSLGQIFSYMEEIGRKPEEVDALFLTHSHPDHIGSAKAIKMATGCRVYGPEAERGWIEDIGRQFRERPIPNFYKLAGESVPLDNGLKGQERLCLEEGLTLYVVETGGHSHGSLSYLLEEENVLFTGDAIPAAGDIPIYVSLDASVASLERLKRLWPVEVCCPAWDAVYRGEEGLRQLDRALELMGRIKDSVAWAKRQEGSVARLGCPEARPVPRDWQELACRRLGMEHLAGNPLFRTSLQCTETDGAVGTAEPDETFRSDSHPCDSSQARTSAL